MDLGQQNVSKQNDLTKMKRFALAVLGLAVLLFLISVYFSIGWLKALSEAAMVGGIADWFAVVALFRHPLGIPIPHTALIPKNKDAIGENLGTFVSEEFLIREKLEVKLEQFNMGKKVAEWVSDSQNSSKVANMISENIIPGILKTIDDEQIRLFIKTQFENRVKEMNFGEWIAFGLESLNKSEKQEKLISSVLNILTDELHNHKSLIYEKVKKSTPFLTFGLVDSKISKGIFDGLYEFLEEAKLPKSDMRKKVSAYVANFIIELKSSPEMQEKINHLVIEFVNKKEVQDYINSIWIELKDFITNDLDKKDDSKIRISISNMIQRFGDDLNKDEEMITKINNFVKNDLLTILLNNKKVIGNLISSTVKSWESKEVSEKLELGIGRDLQFIRINGTVVGGLVGLLIYFAEKFI